MELMEKIDLVRDMSDKQINELNSAKTRTKSERSNKIKTSSPNSNKDKKLLKKAISPRYRQSTETFKNHLDSDRNQ